MNAYDHLPHTDPLAPPAQSAVLNEMTALWELPRLLLHAPWLYSTRVTQRQPVMVMPGFGGTDLSTVPLRACLNAAGFDAVGWGLGRNDGDVEALLPRVVAAVSKYAGRSGGPVQLVGWSLGGVFAREVARDLPDDVARVVTFGTPVIGGPKYTQVGGRYAALGFDLDALEHAVAQRHLVPIRAPITAIYSRRDGIVAWRACIDPWTPNVEHVEVRSSHLGLGIDPDVYRIVLDRLASGAGVAAVA